MHTTGYFTRYVVLTVALAATSAMRSRAEDSPNASPEKEKELIAVLRSDAAPAEKAITCKQLAIYGTSESVAEVAKLLPNPQLSSWARIALEAIPGSAADDALRTAAESLEGRLLVGTLNSIGVRRDAMSVELLSKRLQDKDADVASAAAVALGRIGNDIATKSLRQSLAISTDKVLSAVAEGCVLCAERLHAEGKSSEAAEVYDEVRKAKVPKQRIIEATRGAVLARGPAGMPLLLELFQSTDKSLFQLALGTVREFPGSEIDQALASEMLRAAPDRAALMIYAMADRPKTVVLAAVLKAAESGPTEVRQSAITALGNVGDASCLASLLKIAVEPNAELAQAAKTTLSNLSGAAVDAQIVAQLTKADAKSYPLLIELVGQRRIDAVPELLKALESSDKSVRSATLAALGETVSLKRLSVLISQVVAPKHPEDAPVAQQALKAASVRMPDREACAAELAMAIERASTVATKSSLLEILGAMGGEKALATIDAAAKSSDPQLQDISTRLLGEWMTEDAAPVLLNLAKAPANQYQVRALRGYIRIARQFVLPEPQRAEMCQKAFEASRQPAEQKLVLDVLKRYPSKETLNMAIKSIKDPQLKSEATQATLLIAQKLAGKGVDVGEMLAKAGFAKVKLEIIKGEYGSGSSQKDVTDVLRKHAGDLPLITFDSASYNTTFGGDPLPGSVKQLKIEYRLDGKVGEAIFAEDALIVLPSPK